MKTNDDQAREARLEAELARRIVPPDAPESLLRHVERLGLEPEPTIGRSAGVRLGSAWFGRPRGVRGVLAAFATVAVAAVVVAGGLYWRQQGSAAPTQTPARPTPGVTAQATQPTDAAPWTAGPFDAVDAGALDATFAWAVSTSYDGAREILVVTEDGGRTWRSATLPVAPLPMQDGRTGVKGAQAAPPHDVTFTDPDHAFFFDWTQGQDGVGGDLSVYRSSDGGRNWTRAVVGPTPASLPAPQTVTGWLDMLDATHGWLDVNTTGGVALYGTTDGGAHWTKVATGAYGGGTPSRVEFSSATDGWGTSRTIAAIYRTQDGGRTWTQAQLPIPEGYNELQTVVSPRPSGSGNDLAVYAMVVEHTGIYFGPEAVVRWSSSDGGATWTVTRVDSDPTSSANEATPAIVLLTDARGRAATITGGAKPAMSIADAAGAMHDFALSALLGHDSPSTIGPLEAVDGSNAWTIVHGVCASGGSAAIPPNHFASPMQCGALYKTTDAGATWTAPLGDPRAMRSPVPACCGQIHPLFTRYQTGSHLAGWIDPTHGWAIVGMALRWTDDGGTTWTASGTVPASGAVEFLDREHGWLAASTTADPIAYSDYADSNPVYRTDDGGRTWTAATLPALDYWEGWSWLHFTDLQHGIVARCESLIAAQNLVPCRLFQTEDGGVTFTEIAKQDLPAPIQWASRSFGFGIEYDGGLSYFAETNDGGATWTRSALPTPPGWDKAGDVLVAASFDGSGGGRLLTFAYRITGDTQTGGASLRFETSDGGRTWRLGWSGASTDKSAGQDAGIVDGMIYDVSSPYSTALVTSDDFGTTWTSKPFPHGIGTTSNGSLDAVPVDLAFADRQNGVLVVTAGYGTSPTAIYVTHDGGASWTRVP